MSLLQQVTSTRESGGPIPPVRINIQGTDGIGKSTFGANADQSIFIQAEDGLSFMMRQGFLKLILGKILLSR